MSLRKKSKDRIVVLLCCSMVKEKLTPLIIGRAKYPAAIRLAKIDVLNLPVHLKFNKSPWMRIAIFEIRLSE